MPPRSDCNTNSTIVAVMSQGGARFDVARQRARRAGKLRDLSELTYLRGLLGFRGDDDGGAPLGKVAAWAIAQMGPEFLLDEYRRALDRGDEGSVVADLAYGMGKARTTPDTLRVLEVLAIEGEPEVALWACLALADTKDAAVRFLAESIASPRLEESKVLLFADALSRVSSTDSRSALRRALLALPVERREAVVRFMASITSEKAVPPE